MWGALTRRQLLQRAVALGTTLVLVGEHPAWAALIDRSEGPAGGGASGEAGSDVGGGAGGQALASRAAGAASLLGLVHRKGFPPPAVVPWLAGGALAVDHAALRPSPTVTNLAPIVTALDTYGSLGLAVRLRVKLGTGAAPWLAERAGALTMHQEHPPAPFRPIRGATVARWWTTAYLDELALLTGRLGAALDGHPALADVNLAAGAVFSAGDGMVGFHENHAALRAAGYRLDDDLAARRQAVEIYARAWPTTGVVLGLAPFEAVLDDGTLAASNEITTSLAEDARAGLGDRLVLGHYALVGDARGRPLGTQDQLALFRWMADRAAAGWRVAVQVENRERILAETAGPPSVDGTVLAAVKALGARSVEIPADPTQPELRRWKEYFSTWPASSSRWPKPPIVGLVDRDGSASGYAYRRHAGHFGAIVGRVDHAEVHVAPGRFDFGAIDRLLEEAETYGLALRLRLYLGIQVVEGRARTAAPAWLVDRLGTARVADPNWVGAGDSIRFWHADYLSWYRELMAALADRYDHEPRLAEVHGLPGAIIGGETMIQRYDNAAALEAAGYPGWQADRDRQIAALQDFAELWPRTGCYVAINAFQRLGTSASLDTSLEIVEAGVAAMGGRLRPANNSLVANDRLVELRGGAYADTYQRMRDEWAPSGLACQIQTGNPANIDTVGDGSGTLAGTVRYAATVIGAASVELPVTYTAHLAELAGWASLFSTDLAPSAGPTEPPLGPRALASPGAADPAYCRGRVKGELYGDGHPGRGSWEFTGDEGRRAELVRCLEELGWPYGGGAPAGSITVAYSVLASGWTSLLPARGAPVTEVQGWCGGVVEGEGSQGGLVWDLTVRFATGLTLAERERVARDKSTWCADQWRRLGARPTIVLGGAGEDATWRVQLGREDHAIAQAIAHYVSWGRVPGGRP